MLVGSIQIRRAEKYFQLDIIFKHSDYLLISGILAYDSTSIAHQLSVTYLLES